MSNEDQVEQDAVQEETVDTEAVIREGFDESIALSNDEDQIKMDMIQAGATFKNVTRLYNQFMIDAGLAISKADRTKAIDDTLEGREFETVEDFDSAVNDVIEAVQGSTDRSAAALVRSYAKRNELECYAKPKSAGTGKAGFASKFYAFLIASPACTVEEATAFIKGEGDHDETSSNTQKHASHYLAIHAMVNTIAAA